MKKTVSKILSAAALLALPAVAFAQTPGNLTQLISWAGDILNRLIPILIAVALLVFFWGLIKYILNHKSTEGRQIMIAGLVGLFIMTSVWGIIRLAQNTFGVNNSAIPSIPQVPQR